MFVRVSVGECLDKLTILELKKEKISDSEKQVLIQQEIDSLSESVAYKNKFNYLYRILYYYNEIIWKLTDIIKSIDVTDSKYSYISYEIFENNQRRFRVKNMINLLSDSNIKEQKSYGEKNIHVHISNNDMFSKKISEIIYFLTNYDNIFIDKKYAEQLKKYIDVPSIKEYELIESNKNISTINLSDYIMDNEMKKYFEYPVIKYISGGLFGDFIHQLSVIKEKYIETGKKGILYIANIGDNFRMGVEYTYGDTFNIISKQKYILDYKLHNGEGIDINLSQWRYMPYLSYAPFHMVFSMYYGIKWGNTNWLEDLPQNDTYKDIVFINTSIMRFPRETNYKKFKDIFGEKLIFLSSSIDEYKYFTEMSKIDISVHYVDKFDEMCMLINSCKLFIGALSGMLTIAHACGKQRIVCLPTKTSETLSHYFDVFFKNLKYDFQF